MKIFISSLGSKIKEYTNFRISGFNIYVGFGGATKTQAIDDQVDRVGADVLGFTEMDSASDAYVRANYGAKGYDYFYGGAPLLLCSKYPITYSETLSGVLGPRKPIYIEVTIEDFTVGVICIHNTSWCAPTPCNTSPSQLPAEPNAYDRCVEMYQTMLWCDARKLANPNLSGFVMVGDYNDDIEHPQKAQYLTQEAGGHSLPAPLTFPIDYAQFPQKPMDSYSGTFTLDLSTDLVGQAYTIWEDTPNAAFKFPLRMDYVSYSDDVELVGGEIVNSEVDSNTGLPKYGSTLAFNDSRTASDHKMVFADLRIEKV